LVRKTAVRFAWAITGAGDYLRESVAVIQTAIQRFGCEVLIFLSKAGLKVVKWYKLQATLETLTTKVYVEEDANTPFLAGPLQKGIYRFLVVMPATANTVAKIAHGIADTLVSNCVAQAQKANLPIYIYPVDQVPGTITTVLPSGERLSLMTRDVDLANIDKLKTMKGITILKRPEELLTVLQ
jgi:archaeoflavoprotein AfpA